MVTDDLRAMRDQLTSANENALLATISALQSVSKLPSTAPDDVVRDLTRGFVEMQRVYEKAARCAMFGIRALRDASESSHENPRRAVRVRSPLHAPIPKKKHGAKL